MKSETEAQKRSSLVCSRCGQTRRHRKARLKAFDLNQNLRGKYDRCWKNVLQLVVITLLPVGPLLLTMIPLEELLVRLLKVVF